MTENYKIFLDAVKMHEDHLKAEIKASLELESESPYIDDYQKRKTIDGDNEIVIFISNKEINEFNYNKDIDKHYHNRITGKALNLWLDYVIDKVKV
ncbi:hypothetical protein [Oceanobacillus timonensis]|uniref:hypothetical protein n=1 Tax=Oceanobacillus timonensis TaxID=1926285 RepID=UPI0009B9DB40|nr:hypothetical protein [Oceanobacillus timonensis]